jgi:catechol 2,3-dioxygenase-like lactoylglutathione lyase family enzyme
MFRDIQTETEMQKFLNLEGVFILIAIGADILIEALKNQDWIAAAVIGGFCVIGGLYWHTIHLDRLFADVSLLMHRIAPHQAASPASAIALPASPHADVPVALVADRPLLHVSNFPLSRNFYAAVLAPLGYALTMEFPALSMAAFGIAGASDLWIKGDGVERKLRASFTANSARGVDDFCQAALDAGGTIAETPGPRADHGASAYAAAISDPDGYTIEAVFYGPASA